MAKFRKKPVVVDAITFDELTAIGIESGAEVIDGVPMSFEYNGHPITNENENAYVIPTMEGTLLMTPDDMLITGVKGEIYPCKTEIFQLTYEPEPVTFVDRMQIEIKELDDKLTKLRVFINSTKFDKLPIESRNLLIDQRMYMSGYIKVLSERLELTM